MLIEHHGRLILRIDNQGENRRVGAGGAPGRIDNERTAQPLSAKALIHRQAADQAGREQAIARQALRLLRRKIGKRKTRRGEGIVGGNRPRRVAGDEAVADPPPDVLRRQLTEIAVKRRDAAGKFLCDCGLDREAR